MRLFITALSCLLSLSLFGQYYEVEQMWEYNYGTSVSAAHVMHQTTDGGYIIAGSNNGSSSNSYENPYIVKCSSDGTEEWNLIFPELYSGSNIPCDIHQIDDGGYIFLGNTDQFGYTDEQACLIKLDSEGNELWTKNYGDSIGLTNFISVKQSSDGGYIVAGNQTIPGSNFLLSMLKKTNAAGVEEWTYLYGEYGPSHWPKEVIQTADGGFAVTSYASNRIHVVKTNNYGIEIWSEYYGSDTVQTDWRFCSSIEQTSDGGYIIAGHHNVNSDSDSYLLKINQNGQVVWDHVYGTDSSSRANNAQQTADGGFIFSSTKYSSTPYAQITKTTSSGGVQWIITGSPWSHGNSVKETIDGGYVLAGRSIVYGVDSYLNLSKYSVTLNSIVDELEALSVLIYPNPASNNLTIDLGDLSGMETSIKLYDSSSKLVFEKQSSSTLMIDVSIFAKGLYTLELSTSDKVLRSQVVVE